MLVLALAAAVAGSSAAADSGAAGVDSLPRLDQGILVQLNAVRASYGLKPLRISSELQRAAAFHSQTMLSQGFFAHDDPDGVSFSSRLKRFYTPAGFASWTAGENLLYSSARTSAGSAIKAWLDSPPHRRNMLDPDWREVGIASMHAPAAGGMFGGNSTYVITMDFGARTGPTKPRAGVGTLSASAHR